MAYSMACGPLNLCLRSPSLDAITPSHVLTTSTLFFYLRIFFQTFCASVVANQILPGQTVGPLTVGKRRFRCRVLGIDGVRDAFWQQAKLEATSTVFD